MMKTEKWAVLDNDPGQLFLIQKQVDSYNRNTKNEKIEIECFSNTKDLVENFNHDAAVLDIALQEEKSGFDAAKVILKKFHKPVVMLSQLIDENEKLASFMSKRGMKISELFSRIEALKDDLSFNSMSIFSRKDLYNAQCVA